MSAREKIDRFRDASCFLKIWDIQKDKLCYKDRRIKTILISYILNYDL